MRLSVILSTFNSPELLEKVLVGYDRQSYRDFELLVADDGSGLRTRRLLDRLGAQVTYDLRHVWHEDRGFRKCAILNRAIEAAEGDYLIVSDGDCIPWSSFIETHLRCAEPGWFLSGGYFKLPRQLSQQLTVDEVSKGRGEDVRWLRRQGLERSWSTWRLTTGPGMGRALDTLTTTRASWNGHNASGWKEDIVRVNGFDERMGYGGEDRELGERLVNLGRRGRQVRYRAICLHLWHERSYVEESVLAKNLQIRAETARSGASFTPYGIHRD